MNISEKAVEIAERSGREVGDLLRMREEDAVSYRWLAAAACLFGIGIGGIACALFFLVATR